VNFRENEVLIVLDKLGIEVISERNNELTAMCPGHELRTGRVDHDPSWNVNSETGLHNCFSCGYKGNLITLVAEQMDFSTEWGRLDVDAAKTWLQSHVKVDLEFLVKQMEKVKDAYLAIPKPVPMSIARLAVFDSPPTWAENSRMLLTDSCTHYNVKWDPETKSWILPIFAPDGSLLGWQEKGTDTRHFRNRPPGIPKSTTLFGYHCESNAEQFVIVESPLDAVRLHSLGIKGAMAIFGASVSIAQMDLISRSPNPPIIAFDNPSIDSAGRTASLKMLDMARKRGLEFKCLKVTTYIFYSFCETLNCEKRD
jgi:hypothetical protein